MSEPVIGEIRLFAGDFAPEGWALCNGQLLQTNQNPALFALLKTAFGGDGGTTFGLPNLQDRVPMHFGRGSVLPDHALGQTGGAATVTLEPSQLPAHSHPALADGTGQSPVASPAGAVWTHTSSHGGAMVYSSAGGKTVEMSPEALQFTGGGQPHNNRQPFLALNFIIALKGAFPIRP